MFPKGCLLYKINDSPSIDKKKFTNNTLVLNTRPTRKDNNFITVRGQRQ